MLHVHRARATLLAFALGATASACAAIWGFQNGIEQSEAGADALSSDRQGFSPIDMGESSEASPTPAVDAAGMLGAEPFEGSRYDAGADVDSGLDASRDSLAEGTTDATLDAPAERDAPFDVLDTGALEGSDGTPNNGDAGCLSACVPAAPAGWGGPFAIYEGTGGPPPPIPPSCAGSYPNAVYDGTGSPNASPASCSCTCGAPTNTTCLPPVANYFTDQGCTAPCGQVNQSIDTSCTDLDLCSSGRLSFSGPTPSGGSCAPNASTMVLPAGWTTDVRLCGAAVAPDASGCSAGQVCAPTMDFPFETDTYCVAQTGSVSCPPGYPASRTYYGSSTDTRGCATCTCGTPTGVTCSATNILLYEYSGCSSFGYNYTVGTPQSCLNSGAASAVLVSASSPSGGMCAPMGGTATGSFTPTTPTSICCTR